MTTTTTTTTRNPDAPHGYRPRTITNRNLVARFGSAAFRMGINDPDNRPCDVCGGSRNGLAVHMLAPRKVGLTKALAAIAAANGADDLAVAA